MVTIWIQLTADRKYVDLCILKDRYISPDLPAFNKIRADIRIRSLLPRKKTSSVADKKNRWLERS